MMDLANIEFTDPMSKAFCRLYETMDTDGIYVHVTYCLAGTNQMVEAGHWHGSEWDKAWKMYRRSLNHVLESIEDWDDK